MSRILVTGGAGYVGSFIVSALSKKGDEPIIYDNLEKGHRQAVPDFEIVEGDLADRARICQTLRHYAIESVIHMAADCLVGESEKFPLRYFQNNIANGLNLLDAMVQTGVRTLVFSSSAAVYGEPASLPIDEDTPTRPTNVYGESKLYYERVLERCQKAYGLRYITLRYFNAAGAEKNGLLGEDHRHETHLIPRVLRATLVQDEIVEVFGMDYPTSDGTCVRDYVHVEDLANAHALSLEALRRGLKTATYNLGNGKGYSVKQVLDTAREITGREIPWVPAGRRPGDPPVLVASSERIKRDLGWEVQIPNLSQIIRTAWAWHRTHPEGYGD
jgi:UDP-glucose 4-epimerase